MIYFFNLIGSYFVISGLIFSITKVQFSKASDSSYPGHIKIRFPWITYVRYLGLGVPFHVLLSPPSKC